MASSTRAEMGHYSEPFAALKIGGFSCYCVQTLRPDIGSEFSTSSSIFSSSSTIDDSEDSLFEVSFTGDFEEENQIHKAPPLVPVGGGGWHSEAAMTQDMHQVRDQAIDQYEKQQRHKVSKVNLDYLSSVTLANYVSPMRPAHLVSAMIRRDETEGYLTGKTNLWLNGSWRVVGWDAAGCSITCWEAVTQRSSLCYDIDYCEHIIWQAFDLNKPGANGWTAVIDMHGISYWKNMDVTSVLKLAQMAEGQFRRRLLCCILVDVPKMMEGIVNLFLQAVKGGTQDKFVFCRGVDAVVSALSERGCDANTCETIGDCLRRRRSDADSPQWFPIVDDPEGFFREELADLHITQDLEYVDERLHDRLRQAVQKFRIHKWGLPEM